MIDKTKIPKPTLKELIELFGLDDSERIIEKENYNYRAITNKILAERMKRRFGKYIWIYIWSIGLVVAIIYYLIWWRI